MKVDTAELPVFFVAVDHECRVIEWNPKAEEITGLARSDVLEKDVGDCLKISVTSYPDTERSQAKGIRDIIIDIIHSEILLRKEVLAPVGDGEYFMLNISALRAENGSPLGAVVVGQDIKQHKPLPTRAQDEHEFQTFFENSNSLIFGVDSCGLIYLWNMQMTEATGFSKEECVGKHFVQVRIF
jgi:PAS domain S-box-containing protein